MTSSERKVGNVILSVRLKLPIVFVFSTYNRVADLVIQLRSEAQNQSRNISRLRHKWPMIEGKTSRIDRAAY